MGGLYNILCCSLGSLFLGVFITLIGIILMFLLIKGWWKDCTFTPISFITGIILFFFLSFQAILICGAVTIKSYSDDLRNYTNGLVKDMPSDMTLTQQDSQNIIEKWSEDFPLVGYYVDFAAFDGHTPSDIAQAMVDELNSFMNWFIIRRVAWSLFFIIVGAIIVIKSMYRSGDSSSRRIAVGRGSRRIGNSAYRTRRVHRRVR